MTAEIFIPGPLPRLNGIIEASKTKVPWLCKGKIKVFQYTLMKEEWLERISPIFLQPGMPKFKSMFVEFVFYEPNKGFDPDNVAAGARKIIFDAMVKCKVIKNDGWKQTSHGWNDRFAIDKQNPGVYMLIKEMSS
jgi:hypothetical protein